MTIAGCRVCCALNLALVSVILCMLRVPAPVELPRTSVLFLALRDGLGGRFSTLADWPLFRAWQFYIVKSRAMRLSCPLFVLGFLVPPDSSK